MSFTFEDIKLVNIKTKDIWVNNAEVVILTASHLQQHVPGFDTSIGSHSASLHDGADVNTPVAPFVALAHDADTQKVVLLCQS